MPFKALAISTAALMLQATTPVFAQPDHTRPPPPRGPSELEIEPLDAPVNEARPNEGEPRDAESLRKRLNQTLAFAQRIVETHEAALAQLDSGESPREVMRLLRSPEMQRGSINARRVREQSGNPGEGSLNPTEPPEMSPRDAKRVRSFIAQHLETIDAQLMQVEQISPEATKRLIGRLAPKILEILHLEEEEPAIAALKLDELKSGLAFIEVAGQYRGMLRTPGTSDSDIEAAKERVRQAASDRFDAQVQIKQYEIHQLTMRIQELHIALDDLNSQRDTQVESMIVAAAKNPRSHAGRHSNTENDSGNE